MSAALSSRVSSGGITKRTGGGGRARVDRDGDLDMDAPAGGRGRGRGGRGGRRAGARPTNINSAPKGPAAERGKVGASGSGVTRTRTSGRKEPINNRSRAGTSTKKVGPTGPTVGVRVQGWKESKGSAEECVRFLERKTNLRFRKTQKQGEFVILYVQTSDLQSVLDWDKAKFAGINLNITADVVNELFNTTMEDATPKNSNTTQTISVLEEVLRARYNPETKLLDLSKLGDDPLLKLNGFFELGSTTSKMFPALMAVADKRFDTAQQKRDLIVSVSLAHNNLKTIGPVTTLSLTFPDIKNLSLEGNMIDELRGLDAWRTRFRSLEQLVLTGNAVASVSNYRNEIIRRYPRLIMLDNIQVERPQIGDPKRDVNRHNQNPSTAIDASGRPILPLQVKENLMVDANGIAMAFLSDFFSQIDTNKSNVLSKFYNLKSKFSISVNTSAPRVEAQQGERQYWDPYIPKSRNMKRIHDGAANIERLAHGPEEIRDLWNSLPETRHNLASQDLWSFDIFPAELVGGVSGLLATVHSEFEELNTAREGVIKRSFDRSFMLLVDGPGNVQVLSDLMTVRSYAGASAWKVGPIPPVPLSAGPPAGEIAPVDAAELAERQRKCQMLAEKTGLNLNYAEMCLVDTNWELADAWEAFMWAKQTDKLGPEAYAAQ